MVMTKKNYEEIAKVIKDRVEYGYSDGDFARENIAYDLADYFKKDNPKFKKEKFLKAWGVE